MATERRETGRRWGRVARRALVCAYAAACVPGARAASFTALGHYGFVTLKADETPGATAFTARVESPSGTGDVRRVYARSVADGWQIYVGGWPAAAQGLADLVLLAQGPDGTRDVRFSRTVQTTAGRIDVALVIDDSYSMRKTDPLRLRVKALTLFARLAASRGVVRTLSVIAFERRPRLVLPPTPPDDADAFERALGALVARGSTDLDAALILAEKTLASLPDSRKIVVVLSDGKDEPGRYESAHRRFTASRIPVYTVGLSKLADRTTLERIAQETGGTFSFAPDMTRLEAIFQEIVLAIHPAVRIGTWDLTVDDAGVPIDESVRLLTLKLTADEDAQAVVMPPDGGGDTVALRTAHAAEALAEQYAPARGLWRATGLGVLAATAESDLELVLFPPTGMATDAVPHAVAALVLRDGEAMTNGCEVSLVTTAGGAQQRLEATGRGYFEGYAVPSGAGTMDWQVTVRGVTRADYPFQRVTAQEQPVVPMRRDALWVRPEPLRLELDPGCTVTGRVVIAGRGRFSAEVEGVGEEIGEGVASLLRRAGDIPEGRPLDLGLVITAGSDARPGVVTGRVVVTVGKLPRAEVRVSLRIRAPPIAIGPERLEWPHVAPGQVVTGTVWGVVQAADNACRVRGVTQGFDGHPGRVRDVTLGVETTRWHVVVETAGIGATTQLTGRVAISWGWDGVEVPWTVAVVVPTPEPEPEPVVIVEPEPEVEHQPAIEPPLSETKSDTDVAPEAAVDEPAHPATPPVAVASPKAPPETPPVTPPVAQARYNKWRIAAVLLLLLMLLLLLWRMTRGDGNRLTKFFAASLVVHLLVFLLTLDLLLQTRVVTLQQISPTLAVTIAAMEEKLGFAIAPASGPVAVQDTQSEPDAVAKAEIAREAEEAREAADLAQPDRSAEAVAAMEALEREQNPEALERQADDVVRETTPAEAPAEEALAVEAKRRESEQAAERARAIEALRAESVEQRTEERREMQAAVTDNAAVQDVSVTAEQIERRAAEALRAAAEAAEREQPRTPEDIQEEIRQTAGKHSERPDEAEAARQVDLQRVEADGGAVERKTTAEAVAPVAAGSDAARDVAALVTAGGAERAAPEAARGEAVGPERQAAKPTAVAAEAITLAAGAQRHAVGEPGAAAVKPSAAAVARASEADGGAAERKTTADAVAPVAAGSDAARDVVALVTAGGGEHAAPEAARGEADGPERQAAKPAAVAAEAITLAAGAQRRAAGEPGAAAVKPSAAAVARASGSKGGAAERKTTADAVAPVAAGSDAARDVAALVTAGGAERAAPEAARGEAVGPERQAAKPTAVAAEAITLAAGAQRHAVGEPGAAAVKPSAAAVARASEADGGAAERKTTADAVAPVAAGSDAARDVVALVTAGGGEHAAPEAARGEADGPERQAAKPAAVAAEAITLAAGAQRRAAGEPGAAAVKPSAAAVARASGSKGGAAERKTTADAVAPVAAGSDAARDVAALVTEGGAERAAPEAARGEAVGPERQAAKPAAVAAEAITLAAGAQRRAAGEPGAAAVKPSAAAVARASGSKGGAAERKTTADAVAPVAAGSDAARDVAALVTAGGAERAAPEAARGEAVGPERQASKPAAVAAEAITLAAGAQRRAAGEPGAAAVKPSAAAVARASGSKGGAAERKTTADAVAPVAAGSDAARDVAALVTAGGAERAAPEAARGEAVGPERQASKPAAVAAEAITLAAGAQRRAAGEPGAAAVKPSAAAVARASESDGGPEERKTAKAVAAGSAEARRPDAVRDVAISLPTATDQPQQRHDGTAGDLALKSGGGGQGTVSATLALAQYGGDWDCARTAMMFLSHQLRERTGMALMAGDTVIRLDQPELHRLPFVYLTGHNDFHFTDAEVRNLRDYLQQGGHLWADDSTHYRDETFDRAFRREIARVLPDAAIERLDARFGGWRTGYDLTHGYKEYAIPPGDKYRQNFIEGIRMGDRVAVVYTRNDYGDGLNIDPHTQPLKDSLTSLSPAEMQEGATRMGINLVLYFLSQHGGIDLPFVEKAASGMRGAADPSAVALPEGTTRPVSEAGDAAAWFYEEWGDPAEGVEADGRFVVRFQVGAQEKAAFGRMCEPPLSLKPGDTLAFDVESLLPCGARVALGLDIGGHYLETAPFYIKPGVNAAFFVCSTKTFKSETTAWEYREALPLPAEINKINLLIYAPAGGELRFGNFRIVGQ